jgi:NAD(P)-dependent dehydrogenase (short-subunit alcohol dehydrogenase family)
VTLARLHKKAPDLAHTVHYADLTRISEMKRVAAEIASQEPRIDVLINNAGAMFGSRRLTEDGLEYTFALNHMVISSNGSWLRRRHASSIVLQPPTKGPGLISTTCNRRRASEP